MSGRVLLLLIEPTTYMLGLIDHIRQTWTGQVEVLFVSQNRSQQWDLEVSQGEALTLPFFSALAVLWRRLRSEDYVLIHLAGWGEPLILSAWLICQLCKIPFSIQSDTQLRSSRHWFTERLKKLAYTALFRLPSMFLPAGTRQAAYLRHYGVGGERICIGQMTVDVEYIMSHVTAISPSRRCQIRQQLGFTESQVVFLSVGRLEPIKGIHVLLDAFSQLSTKLPHIGLLVVGDGSLRGEVSEATRRFPGIRCTGRLAGDDLWDCYAVADVFVFPSLEEPWGLVANEAMAAGLPMVVSDSVGCVDDLLIPAKTGLSVPAGSVESLARAMETLANSPTVRRAMAKEARQHIGGWTLKDQAERFAQAWQEATKH